MVNVPVLVTLPLKVTAAIAPLLLQVPPLLIERLSAATFDPKSMFTKPPLWTEIYPSLMAVVGCGKWLSLIVKVPLVPLTKAPTIVLPVTVSALPLAVKVVPSPMERLWAIVVAIAGVTDAAPVSETL